MAKCAFCGDDIERGTGKVKYMKDNSIIHLCGGMKCEKNMFKLKRTPRKVKWTLAYKIDKDMRMATAAHGKKTETVKAAKSVKATPKTK